jgi:16S rRNA (cytosine1402-N4)-methyltransferase
MDVEHISVLAGALIEQINLPTDAVMVDATIGHGGHSFLFGRNLGAGGVIIGLDVDTGAISKAQKTLDGLACKVVVVQSNFSEITQVIHQQGLEKVDFILADLGLCSAQLADADCGLSFLTNMPLDMRIDKRITTSAADIVNSTDEKSLADLIYEFGEERASRRIARYIVQERKIEPIRTTGRLAEIVCRALRKSGQSRNSRIHPATRTFQALRIAVNNELENLKELLVSVPALLKKDGRIAIISFHSLEDRLVKNNFKDNEKAGIYKIVTKKPIVPDREEIDANRRSRSAKLRIAQKI